MHRFSFVRKPVAIVAIAATSVLLVAGGVAYATIPDSNSVIHSCYATKGGGLRVIDTGAGESCSQKESPLDWNAQGPKGDQGAAGVSGLEEDTKSASIPPGGFIVNVDCPTGKLAISGGWSSGGFDAIDVELSAPNHDDTGWGFVFFNTTSSTVTVTAIAMCANAQ